ncbi:hypothetical protein BSLA_03f0994 [Burkholderia stabilis]|nr:hypothetical protein BSLA_03f0994 [Burkholderia stabilis]
MQYFQYVKRACANTQRRAMAANVSLLEIHRQRPDLDHGRLQVPHDDRHVNTAVHRGGNAHPASPAGRAQNLKKWAECKRRINKNLEGKCAGDRRIGTPPNPHRADINGAIPIGMAPSHACRADAARIGPLQAFRQAADIYSSYLGAVGCTV